MYICDPYKNKNCPKHMCFLRGGPCRETHHEEFAAAALGPFIFEHSAVTLIDYGCEKAPCRKHLDDAGADVYTMRSYCVEPHSVIQIPLGFGIVLPKGYAAYIEPRGSVGMRGLFPICNPIDCGYTGEVHANMWNITSKSQRIERGVAIAQLVIKPCAIPGFSWISPEDALKTERGNGCYGSTDEVPTND